MLEQVGKGCCDIFPLRDRQTLNMALGALAKAVHTLDF